MHCTLQSSGSPRSPDALRVTTKDAQRKDSVSPGSRVSALGQGKLSGRELRLGEQAPGQFCC